MCGKPVDAKFKPFCSKRCANIDLHRWLSNSYAIAGAPHDEDEDPAAERSDQD
nr:DNA gyrase inhibitor YacG [Rhodoblastus sphagnicola]